MTTNYVALCIYRNLKNIGSPDARQLVAAVSAGMIPKSELKDGVLYIGHCRNASEARWEAGRERFVYMRTKFGNTFPEEIEHPEDDRGFDIFVPVEIAPEISQHEAA